MIIPLGCARSDRCGDVMISSGR